MIFFMHQACSRWKNTGIRQRLIFFFLYGGTWSIINPRFCSCNATRVVLEMDRILRPGGSALIRDSMDVIQEIEAIANAVRWRTQILETDRKDKLLFCKKLLWHA